MSKLSKSYKNRKSGFSLKLERQLEFSFSDEKESKRAIKDENLGQVFTSPILAKFMVGLFGRYSNPKCTILDPCIGPNTFFQVLPDELSNCFLKGIEVDKNLINEKTKTFFNSPKRSLIQGSFFDLDIIEKFDLIIQNPPYVRQELLVDGINSKKNIQNKLSFHVPPQSNLYIYFLLKSILHLKENGVMIAVIYDSWLYNNFGKFLKESFLKLGYLESIYHFKKSAFENAEVGATVIRFLKNKSAGKLTSYYSLSDLTNIKSYNSIQDKPYKIRQNELITYPFNNSSILNYESALFSTLSSIVSQPIQRGTSAIINNYFIFSEKKYSELKPIVKDVFQIKSFKVSTGNAFVLSLNGSISDSVQKYLESVKNKILETPLNKYKAVKRDIKSGKNWYSIKLKSCGNFIFNYYLRNHIDFIYNPYKVLSSDNFYSVNINYSELAYLSILNSSFTRLNILSKSRNQGNGLRKIQLYEFKEVKIIDINSISKESINQLEELGKSLIITKRYDDQKNKIIRQIDHILLTEYNQYNNTSITNRELENELKEYIN